MHGVCVRGDLRAYVASGSLGMAFFKLALSGWLEVTLFGQAVVHA